MSDINIQPVAKKKRRYKAIFPVLLFPISVALLLLTRLFPAQTEQYYSSSIYPYVADLLGAITGWVPFSIAEMILIFVPLSAVIIIANSISYAKKENKLHTIIQSIINVVSTGCVLFLMFAVLSGVNYNRISFDNYLDIQASNATKEDLSRMCSQLISRANTLNYRMIEDEKGSTQFTYNNTYELASAAADAYVQLGEIYPILSGRRVTPKPVVMSEVMSYAQITGIFAPFTMEANYNANAPQYTQPATICHEITHVKGFMREDEANFIAYLACSNSNDPQVEYSGVMLALVHSMNALYSTDYNMFLARYEEYSEGVRNDLIASSSYWQKYDGNIAKLSDKVNDMYLKANNQTDGVQSYGRMVDLLLAEYMSTKK